MKTKDQAVLAYLHKEFPDAGCALSFSNDLECLVSILLSAQTTDNAVNKVTPGLFMAFPDALSFAEAEIEDIESKIRSIGLYHNKAKNLKALGQTLVSSHQGNVPHDFDVLKTLPGVGAKTAGVFLLERDTRASIPVDTHVERVSKRLKYANEKDKPLQIEAKLEKTFPKDEWKFLHHSLIWFGRLKCHAKRPECAECPLKEYCSYFKKTSSTTAK